MSMPEETILKKLYTDLETIFPNIKKLVKGYDLIRFQYGYPVMTPGAYRRLTRLHAISNEGVFLAGDYMIYPTFEAAAVSGMLAAERAEEWLED